MLHIKTIFKCLSLLRYSYAHLYSEIYQTLVQSHRRERPALEAWKRRKGMCMVSFEHVRWGVIYHISWLGPECGNI